MSCNSCTCEILEKGFGLSRSPIYPGILFSKPPTETTTHTRSWEGNLAIAVSYRLADLSFAQEVKELGTLLDSGQSPKHLERLSLSILPLSLDCLHLCHFGTWAKNIEAKSRL